MRQLPVRVFCSSSKSLWLWTTHSTHQTIPSAIVIQTLQTILWRIGPYHTMVPHYCALNQNTYHALGSATYCKVGHDTVVHCQQVSLYRCKSRAARISHWVQQSIQLSWNQAAKSIQWQRVIKITIPDHHHHHHCNQYQRLHSVAAQIETDKPDNSML